MLLNRAEVVRGGQRSTLLAESPEFATMTSMSKAAPCTAPVTPIAVGEFLASWGVDTTVARHVTPDDNFETSSLYRIVLQACDRWRHRSTGPRPDLAGAANKTLGTRVATEIRAELSRVAGFAVDDDSLADIGVDVVCTRIGRPQAGIRMTSSEEKLFGNDRHLLVVVFDLAADGLSVDSMQLFKAWEVCDTRTTRAAERLRAEVAAGNLELVTALQRLEAEHGVSPTVRVIEALSSLHPVAQGKMSMSAAAEWRVRFPRDGHDLDPADGEKLELSEMRGQGVLDLG